MRGNDFYSYNSRTIWFIQTITVVSEILILKIGTKYVIRKKSYSFKLEKKYRNLAIIRNVGNISSKSVASVSTAIISEQTNLRSESFPEVQWLLIYHCLLNSAE